MSQNERKTGKYKRIVSERESAFYIEKVVSKI